MRSTTIFLVAVLALSLAACNSDRTGTAAAAAAPAVDITLLEAIPATVAAGQSTTVQWAASNATTCQGGGTLPGWAGDKTTSGQQTLTLAAAGRYDASLTCQDAQGGTDSITIAITVTSTTIQTPPPPAVTINSFSASPAAFVSGLGTRLAWTSSNATGCQASGALPGWSGALPANGDRFVDITVTAGDYLAELVCSNAAGASAPSKLTVTVLPADNFALANRCFALKSIATNGYTVRNADGTYRASAPDKTTSEPFFMKPTALGKYLFFARNQSFLAASGNGVGSVADAAEAADWTIDTNAAKTFLTVASASAGKSLAVNTATGNLILADTATAGGTARFAFEAATGCAEFPELATNSSGATFKGTLPDGRVLGFADVHIHISAVDFLGGVHGGRPFHRFGVTQAVGSCEDRHGKDGREDVLDALLDANPLSEHDTQGWPTFVDWPARGELTHEGTYYKWVERAWQAGLRLAVNDLVENEALCALQRNVDQNPNLNCNEMDSAEYQAGLMREMQDYIDAQEGGPGKGWFRIVTTPAEARAVIAQGKLAVVFGIEISHLFNCGIYRVLGEEGVPVNPLTQEARGCSEEQIVEQLDRLHNLGVRQMFPLHEFDNAIGGNGIFADGPTGVVLNLGNRTDTGEFWTTYDCPDGGTGDTYLFTAGAILNAGFPPPAFFGNPIADQLVANAGGQVPLYDTSARQCNARAITPLGRFAIQKLMEKGVIIEADHMELRMKEQVIEMARAQTPDYPLVSTHGGHGGISNKQAADIIALGGIIYDSNNNGKNQVAFQAQLLKAIGIDPETTFFGLGFGSDINGLSSQPGPRGTENKGAVNYPFTLFQGPGWGPQFAGMAPVAFGKSAVPVGDPPRSWDIDADGVAHYGLVADFVEELRIEGGEPAITALFNSAEAYLQMWERTIATRTVVPVSE